MAAVANLKQMHVTLPKIPVVHSGQHKVKDVTKLAVESQPVIPSVGEAGEGTSHAGLPAVNLSLDGTAAKPKSSGYLRRSLTSVPMVTGEDQGKRSELKSSWLKANDVKNPFQYTVEELNEIVQEKITSGFHGLKHLFRSHTANGNGLVSRDALHRILIGVCGYISKDLFDRYMKKLTLQHDQYISFEMFITKFPENEVVRKEWLMPIQQAKVTQEAPNYPEQHFRKTTRVIRSNIAPASFFVLFLKDLVKNGKFKPELHLPDSVRDGKEELLKPHIRHIVTKLSGYDITDSELDKLWFRFDQRGVGSVPGEEFCKMIGYDQIAGTFKTPPDVQLLTAPASVPTALSRTPSQLQCRTTPKASSPSNGDVEESLTHAMEKALAEKKVNKPSPLRKMKGFTSVVEELIYRMELPSVNLIAAFEPFDVLKDNFVSKIDFRRVLKQFGFPIGALDLETFLSRNSLRVLNNLIEYKDFIRNFTNREDFGPVSKIVNDPQHVFNTEVQNRLKREGSGVEGWSAEELEAGLVEYFMGLYVKLLLNLRNMDPKLTRLLPEGKIKPLLETILGRQFQKNEWKYLLSVVGVTEDGHIPYENVIAVINNRRPSWNQKSKLGHQVTVIQRPATTLELERLREGIHKEKTMHTHISPLDHLRSLDDMSTAIRELMKTRFRALDYAYRYQDRKMTGRLDKHMLRRILQECGVDFEPKEMDKLWGTFALAPDGLYTWSKFCQRYVSDEEKLKQASQAEERKEENYLTSAAGLRAIPVQGRGASQAASRVARPSSKITDPVLTKIKFEVVSNLDSLESLFKDLDVQRRGHVTLEEAKETFKVLKIRIAADELKHICQLFDLEGSSRFHYKSFLSLYKPRPQTRLKMQSRQSLSKQPTFVRPSSKMLSNRLVQELKGKGPEMRRQFKKSDPLGQGVLSVRDFKYCLEQLGINCGSDDSFSEVTSNFDHSLRGQINYEEFSALCHP